LRGLTPRGLPEKKKQKVTEPPIGMMYRR